MSLVQLACIVFCTGVECPGLSPPAFGSFNGTGRAAIGGVVTFSCNPGFQLIGQDLLTCTSSGEWDALEPSCSG